MAGRRDLSLGRALARTRQQISRSARKIQVDRDTKLTQPEFTGRAHEVVDESMHAVKVAQVKVDEKTVAAMIAQYTLKDLVAQLRPVFGDAPVALYGDKILYLEPEGQLRLDAAKEVLHRQQPLPNRVDSKAKSRYRILRVDPNRREATLEEIPDEPF